jgi:hypothetical protein
MPENDKQPVEGEKRKARPLDLSDDDLDTLAEVTDADILHAAQTARRYLERRYKNLLQAEEMTDNGGAEARPAATRIPL